MNPCSRCKRAWRPWKVVETRMAKVYATLIVKGKKTLDDVPALLRDKVRDILAALSFKITD